MATLPLRVEFHAHLSQIAKMMGTQITQGTDRAVSGISLDSRTLERGDVFFAIKAARDGHDFVANAFAKGASAAVVSKGVSSGGAEIMVDDPLTALGRLANQHRKMWNGTVVAISGSNGKTTTKEMTAAILSSKCSVHKSPASWNSTIGVPLTLLSLQKEHEVCVLEIGISAFGELRQLTRISSPNIGVLTNIGPVHTEFLESVEGVARAKGELFEELSKDATAVINLDDPRVARVAADTVARKLTVGLKKEADVIAEFELSEDRTKTIVRARYGKDSVVLYSPFVGRHNVSNLLCALGVAYALDIPANQLQKGIDTVAKPEMRFEIVEFGDGLRVINDCYNANPVSMAAAFDAVRSLKAARIMIALGDMKELGDSAEEAHEHVGVEAAKVSPAKVFLTGDYAQAYLRGLLKGGLKQNQVHVGPTPEALSDEVHRSMECRDVLLVKGSRGARMERLTEALLRRAEGERKS